MNADEAIKAGGRVSSVVWNCEMRLEERRRSNDSPSKGSSDLEGGRADLIECELVSALLQCKY